MKTIILFFLTILFTSVDVKTYAQNQEVAYSTKKVSFVPNKVDGSALLEEMASNRRVYTKSQKISDLSAPQYIFNVKELTIISFNNLDYVVKGQAVIGINGLDLSPAVLQQITDKLLFLDKVQYDYAQKCNQLYINSKGDRKSERSFLLALKILNTTLNDIASFAKGDNPSLSLAVNLPKMPTPNIDFHKGKK